MRLRQDRVAGAAPRVPDSRGRRQRRDRGVAHLGRRGAARAGRSRRRRGAAREAEKSGSALSAGPDARTVRGGGRRRINAGAGTDGSRGRISSPAGPSPSPSHAVQCMRPSMTARSLLPLSPPPSRPAPPSRGRFPHAPRGIRRGLAARMPYAGRLIRARPGRGRPAPRSPMQCGVGHAGHAERSTVWRAQLGADRQAVKYDPRRRAP